MHHRTLTWMTRGATAVICAAMVCGCKDLTNDPGLPAGTPDPSIYYTAEGAVGMRVAAVADLIQAIPGYLISSALLTDEAVDAKTGSTVNSSGLLVPDPMDERILPEGGTTSSYAQLQAARGAANIALGALAAYDTAAADLPAQRAMRGELFALQGYTEILLAELFCSGVPLSTLDFKQDFTYLPGSTSAQVYTDAATKLDSAIALAAGTDSVVDLAKVLKGRALLELGRYSAAADDVSTVPTNFKYRLITKPNLFSGNDLTSFVATVADREGRNGLPFLSSGDPRSAVDTICSPADPELSRGCPLQPMTTPAKYASSAGYGSFVVADGIEARLIEAEAALHASPDNLQWLVILNTLRTTCTDAGSCSNPVPAGTGGVSGLAPLADSGATLAGFAANVARIAELFHERAYWLFITGHRQGDLRRLIRQYGGQYTQFQSDRQVYPTGAYNAPGQGQYGADVTVPIPTTEYNNPYYNGCKDRNA